MRADDDQSADKAMEPHDSGNVKKGLTSLVASVDGSRTSKGSGSVLVERGEEGDEGGLQIIARRCIRSLD